jgi:uncharacterized protein (UPF0264 family)
LLVSVSNASEARAALEGGADIVDAKDPRRGALEPVTLETLMDIRDVCGCRVPLTAALGDSAYGGSTEDVAEAFARAGASLVKIGFAEAASLSAIEAVLTAATAGVSRAVPVESGVVAVAYADADRVSAASPQEVLAAAVNARVVGILLDTADKNGPGLRALMSDDALQAWVASCRDAGLLVALAGKLSAEDLDWLAPMGIDIVGVRGAACEAGRASQVSAALVRALRARCAADCLHARPLR